METLITILAGLLVSVATYLLLSKNILKVILGTAVMSHAVHLLLMTVGRLKTGDAPIISNTSERYTDALPQALILTAIVISFAVTAFVLVLAYRIYEEWQTDNLDYLRGNKYE